MNFLGHLFFSNNDHEIMVNNLYGDFVKGKKFEQLPDSVQFGVRLHRAIDSYIDHHPVVLNLQRSLYKELPRVASVAVDLFFDHVLAKKWEEYHDTPLADFTAEFYAFEPKYKDYSPKFQQIRAAMKKYNWLYQYQFLHGLYKACNGVSSRLSFENPLGEGATIYQRHEALVDQAFDLFMQEAIPHFEEWHRVNS